MSLDEVYMRRCFELATLGRGSERINPLVGSVIVHDNRIIGEGWHKEYGGPHAEVNAVNSVSELDRKFLSESIIYVNLEPCFHHGKTPPCVDLILREKIKKVVISCTDIDHRVCGQSITKLIENGVEVTTGFLEEEGKHLIRRFTTYHSFKRPYIILKWAQSEDGFIGKQNEQVWLTGKQAKILSHKWRAEESAIMVGTNTAIIDNPQLSNRLYPGKPPLRIVLDRELKLNENNHLLDGVLPTLCVTKMLRQNKENVEFLQLPFDSDLLINILHHLYQKEIKSIIVEGGRELLSSFLELGLWDEARIFTAPIRLGNGIESPSIEIPRKVSKNKIGNDTLEIVYNSTTS